MLQDVCQNKVSFSLKEGEEVTSSSSIVRTEFLQTRIATPPWTQWASHAYSQLQNKNVITSELKTLHYSTFLAIFLQMLQ